MTTIQVRIESNLGPVLGRKGVCDYCSNDEFYLLVIFGHNHIQCSKCGTSFCQLGHCSHPHAKLKPQPKKRKTDRKK
jgi:hypothetical protein